MNGEVSRQVASLEQMSVGQLRERYAEVFGEAARSGNRQWLLRRVAWRIQSLAEGDLASRAIQQARRRAGELARDADLRLRPPTGPIAPMLTGGTASAPMPIQRDERLPPPGTVLTRQFKGVVHRVAILPNGFEYDGEVYRSLSAVAHTITGSHWNGMLFFGLTKNRRKEATA